MDGGVELSSVHPVGMSFVIELRANKKKLTLLPGCHKYIPQHRQTINNLCDCLERMSGPLERVVQCAVWVVLGWCWGGGFPC